MKVVMENRRFAWHCVYMHTTFLLLLGWVAFTGWLQARTLMGRWQRGVHPRLFLVVVLHEYGHALTARKFGNQDARHHPLADRRVARLERMPDDPKQELWVALAGPQSMSSLQRCCFVWLTVTNAMQPLSALTVTGGSFIERLTVVNVILVVFNMIRRSRWTAGACGARFACDAFRVY